MPLTRDDIKGGLGKSAAGRAAALGRLHAAQDAAPSRPTTIRGSRGPRVIAPSVPRTPGHSPVPGALRSLGHTAETVVHDSTLGKAASLGAIGAHVAKPGFDWLQRGLQKDNGYGSSTQGAGSLGGFGWTGQVVAKQHLKPPPTFNFLPGKHTVGRSLNDVADSATYMPSGIYQAITKPGRTAVGMGKGFLHDFTPQGMRQYPDRAILDTLGLASGGLSAAGRVGEAARVARAGEGAGAVGRALVRTRPAGMREIHYGGDTTLALNSQAPLSRIAQRGVDSLLGLRKRGRYASAAGVDDPGGLHALARHRFEFQKRANERVVNAITDAGKPSKELAAPTKTNPVLQVVRPFNRASRATVLYGKLGFGPTNLTGQEWLSAVHQGPLMFQRRAQHAALTNRYDLGRKVRMSEGMHGVDLARWRAASGTGEIRASEPRVAATRLRRGNPLRSLSKGITAADHALGTGYGRILDTPYRGTALLHEMKRQGLGEKGSIQRALSLTAQHGENVRSGAIRAPLSMPSGEARQTVEAARRSGDSMINYDTLGKVGRGFSDAIFFMPWLKGSSLYAGHFLRDHPLQAAAWAKLGTEGKKHAGLGPVPSFMEGMFKVGERNVPGLGRVPLAVNPTSASILGQTPQIAQTIAGMAGLTPNKPGIDPEGYLSPAVYAAVAALTHRDPFTQRQIPQNQSVWTIFKNQLVNSVPVYNDFVKGGITKKYLGFGDAPKSANPTHTLFPRTISDRNYQFTLGGLGRTPVNPIEQQSRYRGELTAGASKTGAINLRSKWFQDDLRKKLGVAHGLYPSVPTTIPPKVLHGMELQRQIHLEGLKVAKMSPNAVAAHGGLSAPGHFAAQLRAYGHSTGVPPALLDRITKRVLQIPKEDLQGLHDFEKNQFPDLLAVMKNWSQIAREIKQLNVSTGKLPYANGGAPVQIPSSR